MAQKGFSKNDSLLNEDYRVEDLLDFSPAISKFKQFLLNIDGHSLVGLVGDYGTGKSTMLYQIEKENPDNWIVFDAWAFPNRGDLWEGFVLDFARKLSSAEFKKARKKIDGTSADDIKSLVGILSEGINLFLPGAGVAKNFSSLFKSSPARRVFEFREMLHDLIKKCDSDLFIVLEDADRAGQEGIIFLETIKQFIAKELSNYKNHKIIFIVPIGRKNYEGPDYNASYRKILDYKFDFDPEINFEKFIEEVFIQSQDVAEKYPYWKENLNELCGFFINNGQTIRDLKMVLRDANHSYIAQKSIEDFTPDARITVLIKMHDFLGDTYSMQNLSRNVKRVQKLETGGKSFYWLFFVALLRNEAVVDVIKNAGGYKEPAIVFVKNPETFYPEQWQDHFDPKNWIKLSDLYLKKSTTEI